MKNKLKLFMVSIFFISFMSCSNNDETLESSNSNLKIDLVKKKDALQNFKKALVLMANTRHETVVKKSIDKFVMEGENQDIVYNSAKELLLSNGMNEQEIVAKTGNNTKAIIGMAYIILAENNSFNLTKE